MGSCGGRGVGAAAGWRWLVAFWNLLLLLLAGGGVYLHLLGPLPPAAAIAHPPPVAARHPPAETSNAPAPEPAKPPALAAPPRQLYAAAWDRKDRQPRIAVLLAGMAMHEAASLQAIADLPAPVSLAVSPYAVRTAAVLAAAQAGGHEILLSLPLEPQNYPLNDPGPLALLTGLAPAVNAERLERVLGTISGFAGVTTALGGLRGERFAGSEAMVPVLGQLARRGLLFVDARPGATPASTDGLYARSADLVLDEPPLRADIEARLAALEEIARAKGTALGIVGGPAPVTVARLAAWSTGLAARGLTLVPVSALTALPEPRK
jgi:polysaccharide deacetylase 2 family uncharacterized protein YibQ